MQAMHASPTCHHCQRPKVMIQPTTASLPAQRSPPQRWLPARHRLIRAEAQAAVEVLIRSPPPLPAQYLTPLLMPATARRCIDVLSLRCVRSFGMAKAQDNKRWCTLYRTPTQERQRVHLLQEPASSSFASIPSHLNGTPMPREVRRFFYNEAAHAMTKALELGQRRMQIRQVLHFGLASPPFGLFANAYLDADHVPCDADLRRQSCVRTARAGMCFPSA